MWELLNNGGTLDFVDRDISCLGQTLQLVKKIKMNKPTQVIGWQDNLGGKYRFCAKSSEEAPSNSWYGFWCFSQNLFFLPRAHCRVLCQTSIIILAIGWQYLEVGSYLRSDREGIIACNSMRYLSSIQHRKLTPYRCVSISSWWLGLD